MEQFKEFQGKNLDESIEQACAYFDCSREKLEIEIIQDAKSGIFGIVGARKAKIRARRASLDENVLGFLGKTEKKEASPHPVKPHGGNEKKEKRLSFKPKQFVQSFSGIVSPQESFFVAQDKFSKKNIAGHAAKNTETRKAVKEHAVQVFNNDDINEFENEGYPVTPFDQLDKERLEALAKETVKRLVEPIADREVVVKVDLSHGRARIKVEWEGDAGLLIGREGMTLAALQYLAARILSRAMNAAVRVQLEIGDYKSRQDEKLKDVARALAEKARQTGRSWSTRPLSSYHRRIIHMLLQDEPGVMTRSSGDGPLKRVIIGPKRESA